MRHARWITLPLTAVIGLLVLTATPVAAERGIPACGDIIAAGTDLKAHHRLDFELQVARSSCRDVKYTVVVLNDRREKKPVAKATRHGGLHYPIVPFTNLDVSKDPDNDYCIFATTRQGGALLDRAPDVGCIQIDLDSQSPLDGPGDYDPGIRACADILSSRNEAGEERNFYFNNTGDTYYTIRLSRESCKEVAYTLTVLNDRQNRLLARLTVHPEGQGFIRFDLVVPNNNDDLFVCVYVTTRLDGRLLDRYPASGCDGLGPYDDGAGRGFNSFSFY